MFVRFRLSGLFPAIERVRLHAPGRSRPCRLAFWTFQTLTSGAIHACSAGLSLAPAPGDKTPPTRPLPQRATTRRLRTQSSVAPVGLESPRREPRPSGSSRSASGAARTGLGRSSSTGSTGPRVRASTGGSSGRTAPGRRRCSGSRRRRCVRATGPPGCSEAGSAARRSTSCGGGSVSSSPRSAVASTRSSAPSTSCSRVSSGSILLAEQLPSDALERAHDALDAVRRRRPRDPALREPARRASGRASCSPARSSRTRHSSPSTSPPPVSTSAGASSSSRRSSTP